MRHREDLIDALFEDRIGEIEAAAEAAACHADAWEGLVEFLEAMLKTQAEDRGLGEVLVSSVHGRLRLEAARGRIKPLVDGSSPAPSPPAPCDRTSPAPTSR